MRTEVLAVASACALAITVAGPARAADAPMSPIDIAVACAPTPTLTAPSPETLRVAGSQDTVPRLIFGGPNDVLVIDGGTRRGVQLDQRFFVRRAVTFGTAYTSTTARPMQTVGWIRIVALNDTTALATIEHACASISEGDLLEPFVAPAVPPGIERTDTTGQLDFGSLGRVLFGDEDKGTGGIGEFMVIDRGANAGAAPGARVAIYRDVQGTDSMAGMTTFGTRATTLRVPLSAVAEAVIVTTGPTMSVVRITAARDAVRSGDLIVPRK
jgi:hypothetical protein